VTGKDMTKNEVYATTDLQDEKLWSDKIQLTSVHWINDPPSEDRKLTVRTRHRAKLIPVELLKKTSNSNWEAQLGEDVRALTPGQSAGKECLGSGIVV
jgi:tRNA U34 2-thiouridine synthase MnmA/TrmU